MSGLDLFAWVVLIVVVACVVAVIIYHRDAPRHDRQQPQPSVDACGDGRGLGHALPWLRALADRGDLGLCRCSGPQRGGGAMIVFLLTVYPVLLLLLVKLKIVPFNLFWKISPALVVLLLPVGLFIPMNWGAPQGPRWLSAIRSLSCLMSRVKFWRFRSPLTPRSRRRTSSFNLLRSATSCRSTRWRRNTNSRSFVCRR